MLQGHNYSCKNSFFLPTCENCAAEEKKNCLCSASFLKRNSHCNKNGVIPQPCRGCCAVFFNTLGSSERKKKQRKLENKCYDTVQVFKSWRSTCF